MNENRAPSDDAHDVDLDDAEAAFDPQEKPMGFLDHLEELRWTLVKCAIAFAVAAGVVAFSLKRFNHLLLWPLHSVQSGRPELELELNTRGVMESFGILFQL